MKSVKTISALLLFSLLIAAIFTLTSSASSDSDYNHSSPSATLVERLFADEFIEEYVKGVALSDVEADFLRAESGFLLAYNSGIPTSSVKTTYENGTLTVTPSEYKYIAENGVEVVWKPISVTLYSEKRSLPSTSYKAVFTEVSAEDKDFVEVEYKASFVIPSEEVNRLINLAYNEAPLLKAEIEKKAIEYEEQTAQYQIDKEEYNEYLSKLAVYETYEAALREYNAKYTEYLNYVKEWNEYKAAENRYNEYLIALKKYNRDFADYEKFLAYAEQNQAKVEAYQKYQAKYEIVSSQLDVIKKTKTPVFALDLDHGRDVYSAIMGDTVTNVIGNKADIVEVLKADKKVVEDAGKATEILRELLKGFFDIKSTQGQYEYYINNYEAFRNNFVKLLQTLDALYNVSGVKGALEAKEKEEKYVILVAQLYYVANALSDEPIKSYNGSYYYDENYEIGRSYKASERYYPCDVICDPTYIVDTNNARPLAEGYPQNPGTPDVLPVEKPTEPEYVAKPTAPTPVNKPKAPAVVPKPDEVKNPGNPPVPYVPSAEITSLVKAYERGELFARPNYAQRDISVEPKITVKKVFYGAETVTVTYYDREYSDEGNKKVLYTVDIDKGSFADYLGKTPLKDEDADYIYTHLFWSDKNGNTPNLKSVSENLELYPTFSSEKKQYETFWEVNGELLSENPGIPNLPEADVYYYDFSGWEKEVDPVTRNVIYRPKFDRPLVLSNNQPLGVTIDREGNYVIKNVATRSLDIETLISRAAGQGGIIVSTSAGEEISFSYLEVIKLSESGVKSLSYAFSGTSYEVSVTDLNGKKIQESDIAAVVKAPCTVPKSEYFVLYYKDTVGNKYLTRSTYENGVISFTAQLSKIYLARTEYTVNLPELSGVYITADKTLAAEGETVYLTVKADPGIKVDYAYITGTDERIYGTSFVMPAHNVTVSARYTVLSYTVEFKSDGKTIVKYEFLKYGDTVTVPQNPKKVSDDKFSYEFIGWTPEVTEVVGNAVYYAQYKATPIERNEAESSVTPLIVKLFSLGVFGVCFVIAVLPASIMTVIMVVRRKRR